MPAPLRRVDSPATPVASWRPEAADGEEEEKTARIPEVVRLLAMSIASDDELEEVEEPAPSGPTPFESGVVARVKDVTPPDSLVLPLVTMRPPAFAFPSAPEVDNEPEPTRANPLRRRLARTVAAAALAGVVLFLLAVVGTKPYFLAARAPRATATRVDPRADRLAVKRPQPVVVTVAVPVQMRAITRVAAPAPRRGIIRVAPF